MLGAKNKCGIIASIQKLDNETTRGIAVEAVRGGAVAIRTDKYIENIGVPLIGLSKRKVEHPVNESYITDNIEAVRRVATWADFVAIDYRRINKNLREINEYVSGEEIGVVADIGEIEDYENIMEKDYQPEYVTTTFRRFYKAHYFDFDFLNQLIDLGCKNIIAEGNVKTRKNVSLLGKLGIRYICIGGAMTDVYKLTKKFVTAYELKEAEIGK